MVEQVLVGHNTSRKKRRNHPQANLGLLAYCFSQWKKSKDVGVSSNDKA